VADSSGRDDTRSLVGTSHRSVRQKKRAG